MGWIYDIRGEYDFVMFTEDSRKREEGKKREYQKLFDTYKIKIVGDGTTIETGTKVLFIPNKRFHRDSDFIVYSEQIRFIENIINGIEFSIPIKESISCNVLSHKELIPDMKKKQWNILPLVTCDGGMFVAQEIENINNFKLVKVIGDLDYKFFSSEYVNIYFGEIEDNMLIERDSIFSYTKDDLEEARKSWKHERDVFYIQLKEECEKKFLSILESMKTQENYPILCRIDGYDELHWMCAVLFEKNGFINFRNGYVSKIDGLKETKDIRIKTEEEKRSIKKLWCKCQRDNIDLKFSVNGINITDFIDEKMNEERLLIISSFEEYVKNINPRCNALYASSFKDVVRDIKDKLILHYELRIPYENSLETFQVWEGLSYDSNEYLYYLKDSKTVVVKIHEKMKGWFIGKGGEHIKRIQNSIGKKIFVI